MLNELKTQIKVIDRKVDAIHRKMRRLETIDLYSAASWQAAWDKHPDLYSQEVELYRQRGNLQAQIAQAEYDASHPKRRKVIPKSPAAAQDGLGGLPDGFDDPDAIPCMIRSGAPQPLKTYPATVNGKHVMVSIPED